MVKDMLSGWGVNMSMVDLGQNKGRHSPQHLLPSSSSHAAGVSQHHHQPHSLPQPPHRGTQPPPQPTPAAAAGFKPHAAGGTNQVDTYMSVLWPLLNVDVPPGAVQQSAGPDVVNVTWRVNLSQAHYPLIVPAGCPIFDVSFLPIGSVLKPVTAKLQPSTWQLWDSMHLNDACRPQPTCHAKPPSTYVTPCS